MAPNDSLKRLGGGRWETRDGRFAIEPQSGTWVIVDTTQTDDLGLPLVRGPFGSLTAAKVAIEGIRTSGPVESPLADRLKEARAGAKTGSKSNSTPGKGTRSGKRVSGKSEAIDGELEPPPEPKWLRDLDPPGRRRARELIAKLEKLDVANGLEIARSEVARDQPALARLALERAIRRAVAAKRSPEAGARAAIDVLIAGRDAELDVRWRLVDGQGRPISEIDLAD